MLEYFWVKTLGIFLNLKCYKEYNFDSKQIYRTRGYYLRAHMDIIMCLISHLDSIASIKEDCARIIKKIFLKNQYITLPFIRDLQHEDSEFRANLCGIK